MQLPKDEDIEFIKHQCSECDKNGVTEEIKEKIPKLSDEATPYHILCFFTAFTQVRCHINWTTGPLLYQSFYLHLEGVHLTTWEDIIDGTNKTIQIFNAQYIAFKATLVEGYKYLNQMDYLQQIKKTKDQIP